MAQTLNVNGVNYPYPDYGEQTVSGINAGQAATNWAVAMTSGVLQKKGGTFTLTADVDFGASYGLKSLYYKSRSASPAAAGQVRLGNTESVSWRDQADSADLALAVTSGDALQFDGDNLQPLTTDEDIIVRKSGQNTRLPKGSEGQVLAVNSGAVVWSAVAGTGDVTGPASSTDNALPRFDGAGGKTLQGSGVTVSDANNMVVPGELQVDGDVTLGANTANRISLTGKVADSIYAATASVNLGSSTDPFGELYLDGATHGGAIFFDGGTSSYIKADATGATLEFGGFTDATLNAGVANAMIDAYTRTTGTTVGARGVAQSDSSGSFSTTSDTYVDVTNLSVTITTSGRPVLVAVIPYPGQSGEFGTEDTSSGGIITATARIVRDTSNTVGIFPLYLHAQYNTNELDLRVPASSILTIDPVGAGTYDYKVQVETAAGASTSVYMQTCRLVAFEL